VRNLKGLGFRIPLNIVNKAHQANQLYPNAISMIDSVRMYEQTCKKVDDRERVREVSMRWRTYVYLRDSLYQLYKRYHCSGYFLYICYLMLFHFCSVFWCFNLFVYIFCCST